MQVASIVFSSPLPQLDRQFDYLIPENLVEEIRFGVAVKVPFGSAKSLKTGYVIEIGESTSYEGKLEQVSNIVSPNVVFTREQYELAKVVAQRQAGIVGELLSVCIPKRSARAETKHQGTQQSDLEQQTVNARESTVHREFITPGLFETEKSNHWTQLFIERSRDVLARGESVLVVVPDFRDLEVFEEAIHSAGLGDFAFRQSSADSTGDRWSNYLSALNNTGIIVYGTRVTCFAPCKNLGLILVWDDVDESHHEQSSPYWNSRDVLLQRSELESVSITFCAHSPSSEVSRLIELGYLVHKDISTTKPLIRTTDSSERLDTESFSLVSKYLADNRPVLIQIANLGFASALSCLSCKEISRCTSCQTALWLDPEKRMRCRNCKVLYEQLCGCGGKSFRAISQGSHAIAEQLSRSFPKVNVQRSTGLDRITKVDAQGTLVIATPGAEPSVQGGYALIVLADAQSMVGYPKLRALEQASQRWANALAHLSPTGVAVAVGISRELARSLKAGDFSEIVRLDMLERAELNLPPASRIVSITAKNRTDAEVVANKLASIPALTSLPTGETNRVAYSYSIANGGRVASDVRQIVNAVSKLSKNKLPGQRVLFINMDDNKVI